MLGRIFTVGGYTLLSRLTGFARDIMLAAILGAGPVADAFYVAFRLPNHFRAIFAEGAFNAAFLPAYAPCPWGEGGPPSASLFADRVFTLLLASRRWCCCALAWLFMPQAMTILAPGFSDAPEQRGLAIELTRITFPYLLLITLVTLYGGILNVMQRFASAAAALDLAQHLDDGDLGVCRVVSDRRPCRGLGRADLRLPAIFFAGRRSRPSRRPAALRAAPGSMRTSAPSSAHSGNRRTLGSMGTQIAMFADTIIGTFLPHWRSVGGVLRRPAQSVADRRDRHRRRHRAAAGNVAAD